MLQHQYLILAALLCTAATPPPAAPQPILSSPQQIEAERTLLTLLEHPDVKAIQAGLRAELAKTEIGQTPDGAATIARAVECMTNSLIFKEMVTYRPATDILWTTEDTPRAWHGHIVGCTGTAGDNPDNIYRGAFLRGGERYEVSGRFDLKRRASQFIIQLGPGEHGALGERQRRILMQRIELQQPSRQRLRPGPIGTLASRTQLLHEDATYLRVNTLALSLHPLVERGRWRRVARQELTERLVPSRDITLEVRRAPVTGKRARHLRGIEAHQAALEHDADANAPQLVERLSQAGTATCGVGPAPDEMHQLITRDLHARRIREAYENGEEHAGRRADAELAALHHGGPERLQAQ